MCLDRNVPQHVFSVFTLLVILAGNAKVISSISLKKENPDVGLNIVQLVKSHGYPIEVHSNIRTSDAYLLDIHRIPHGKHNADQKDKPIALLMHGFINSAADWVVMGPEKSLAYLLADAGYDVWMGNARGTTWSRKHEILNPDKDAEYWDFSFHEIGTRDLSAIIDHILEVTDQKKIFYIGHSQGTTVFFVLASEKPEYNSKIRLMVALAPAAYMDHMISPVFKLAAKFSLSVQWIAKFLGADEFLPSNELSSLVRQQACRDKSPVQFTCTNIIFLAFGWDSQQMNETTLPVIYTNSPAGASTKQFLHYVQEVKSGHFRQYDYHLKNLLKYRSTSPPEYHLENIAAPVSLFYSSNDWVVSTIDVKRLADRLPNLVLDYLVPYPKFTHLDFMYAINMKELLHDRVMELMEKY